jgi:CHASE3 domain sensor protein
MYFSGCLLLSLFVILILLLLLLLVVVYANNKMNANINPFYSTKVLKVAYKTISGKGS